MIKYSDPALQRAFERGMEYERRLMNKSENKTEEPEPVRSELESLIMADFMKGVE